MISSIIKFIGKFFDYLVAVLVSSLAVFCYYLYSPYPFDGINIIYYFQKIDIFFPNEFFFNLIKYYLLCFILGFFYLIFYKKINIGRLWIGILTSLIIYIIYFSINLILFDKERFEYMKIYLIQDCIAILIFYVVLSIVYKKKKEI
jgi:hypothetical protein